MSIIELVIDVVENIEIYKKYIPKERCDGWSKFIDDLKNTPLHYYYSHRHGHWYEVKK